MKKVMLVVLFLIIFLLSGCNSKEDRLAFYQKTMNKYATDYYHDYVNVKNLNVLEVTLGDLKNVNDKGNENYDLTLLEECKDTSKISLYLNSSTGKIERYEYDLECK